MKNTRDSSSYFCLPFYSGNLWHPDKPNLIICQCCRAFAGINHNLSLWKWPKWESAICWLFRFPLPFSYSDWVAILSHWVLNRDCWWLKFATTIVLSLRHNGLLVTTSALCDKQPFNLSDNIPSVILIYKLMEFFHVLLFYFLRRKRGFLAICFSWRKNYIFINQTYHFYDFICSPQPNDLLFESLFLCLRKMYSLLHLMIEGSIIFTLEGFFPLSWLLTMIRLIVHGLILHPVL